MLIRTTLTWVMFTLMFTTSTFAETKRERVLPVTSVAGGGREFAGGLCELKVESQGRTGILVTVGVNGQLLKARQITRRDYPLAAGWSAVTEENEYVRTRISYDGRVLVITDLEKADEPDFNVTEIAIDPELGEPSSIQMRRFHGDREDPAREFIRVTCDPTAM